MGEDSGGEEIAMRGRSGARLHRSGRVLGWLVALSLAVVAASGCTQVRDKSTEELIALLQNGEYSSVTGEGEVCDAAYNLGLRKATEAVDELIAGLSGPAADCMALGLGLIGDLRAVEPLVRALELSRFPVSLAHPSEEDKMEFDDADEALVAIGAPAVESLLTVAAGGNERTRDIVSYVFGRIGDPRAETYLLSRLKAPNATTDSKGRLEADALVRIFGDQIDRLLPLLQSKDTVAIAYGLVGLGRAGTETALSDALMQFGDEFLASFYLNAGNPDLEDAALDWAIANGYELVLETGIPGDSAAPPSWGAIGLDVN